ncbi:MULTISPECIES: carboxylate--amine ligase [unclassified Isoptericola]|uniref:carboxylate--amine ligase n=1 Tax=unclassified Isoptericola TaxID=2623355 RepID=UPI0027134673|nr:MULTISPECIES: carboxylate--amine ligase [unclassified Isoptericola]MDO8148756.1 carboxylate--amine ligase [Isoptericola sp. b515]MDO8151303.1 carboxylate--amine ligase [Isoptericola sp. b408]
MSRRLQPVVLGGDIGAYSLARTFHEAYGVRPVVVSGMSTGLVRHSRILQHVVEPGIDDPDVVVARLRAIADEHADADLIAVGSADWLVRLLVEQRARLEDRYTIPYVDEKLLHRLTDKEGFGDLCAELGIAHPTTVVHDVAAGGEPDTSELTFPVIAKAASTAAYHDVEFAGKKKVFLVDTREELVDLLRRVHDAGYQGSFVVQDYIPGDDSGMRILTCYSDATGKVRFSAYGHVLLEEHTPGALGNPAGIITQVNHEVVEQATRMLEHVGWTGFANFDLKYDPRDGRYVFFELNPRLGRSNFYITAAGANAVKFYVHEHVQGQDPDPRAVLGADVPLTASGELEAEHLYTVLPGALLRRYVLDDEVRSTARRLARRGRSTNPLWYRAETDPRRLAYLAIAQLNQWRKYAQHYPVAEARRLAWRGSA